MLIIPAIHLRDECCGHVPEGEEGTAGCYPTDPGAVVRMWRGENAKALMVIDVDGLRTGAITCPSVIGAMTAATDIPIQLASGFHHDRDIDLAITTLGCYRVVVEEEHFEPGRLARLVSRFGPRKILLHFRVDIRRGDAAGDLLQRLRPHEEVGLERMVLTPLHADDGPPLALLLRVAQATRVAITLDGTVRHHPDLKRVQTLMPRRIDSVILDDVLYSNAFPCQRIWRMAEKRLIERGAFA